MHVFILQVMMESMAYLCAECCTPANPSPRITPWMMQMKTKYWGPSVTTPVGELNTSCLLLACWLLEFSWQPGISKCNLHTLFVILEHSWDIIFICTPEIVSKFLKMFVMTCFDASTLVFVTRTWVNYDVVWLFMYLY